MPWDPGLLSLQSDHFKHSLCQDNLAPGSLKKFYPRKPGFPPRFCLAADSRQEPGHAVVQASVTARVIRNLQPYLHNPHNPMQILLPFVILIKWWKASQAPTCSALSPSGATLTLCPFQDSSWAWCRIRIHKSKFDLLHSQLPKASLAPEITR